MKQAAKNPALIVLLAAIFLVTLFPSGPASGRVPTGTTGASGDRTLSPYFLVLKSENPDVDQLPLKATSAKVDISGSIADVTVTQTYTNTGHVPLEALYIFPASTRAAVYGMKMTIGTRIVEAKIAKRNEARKEYEQAREQGKSASLLEQQRPNVFQMNVANIMPGDQVRVELKYTELLRPTGGIYEFVYPTVVGPRYSNRHAGSVPSEDRWVQNPYLYSGEAPSYTFDIAVGLSGGMPIKELSCPSHKVNVSYDGPTVAKIGLDRSESRGGNRDYLLRYRLGGDRIETGLLLFEGTKENFFLLTMEPPKRAKKAEIVDREYIFVVDVSGSMWGYPLDVSKKLIKDLVGALRPSDLFNVVLFAGGSSVMSPQSAPASPENIARAIALIEKQQGGGGTELLPAFRRALALPKREGYSRTIVIATDGFVEVEEETFDLIRNNLGNTNVFAFGIGTSVNRHLIEGMAAVGMGESFVVTRPEEAPVKAGRFRAIVESPVLTGVTVKFDGFDAYDVEPPHVPDVLQERPVIVFGKYRGKPHGKIIVSGISGSGPFQATVNAEGIRPAPGNGALRYLWARHRIALLSDYNSLRPDDRRISAVTELGLQYNLLTAYTSFVAVDTRTRASDGKAVTVKQPLPLPEGVSDNALESPAMTPAYSPSAMPMESMGAMKAKTGPHPGIAYDVRAGTMQGAPEIAVQPKPERTDVKVVHPITLGDVVVSGGLSKDEVSRVVTGRMGSLEKQYQGSGTGQLVVSLTIRPDGTVKSVKILKGAADWKATTAGEIRKWRFAGAADGKETKVTVTLFAGA